MSDQTARTPRLKQHGKQEFDEEITIEAEEIKVEPKQGMKKKAAQEVNQEFNQQDGKQEFDEEITIEAEEIKVEPKQGMKKKAAQEVKQADDKGIDQEVYQVVDQRLITRDQCWRVGRAEAIIHRNVIWALGAGVLPAPIFDIVAVTAVELKMLKELSDLYGVKFSKSLAKKLVSSLLIGLGSVGLGSLVGVSLVKLIPVLGVTFGVVSVPIFAGALTQATGRVFMMHFESGGTFLDFNPHSMRSYFNQEFENAKEKVSRMHKEGSTATCVRAP